MSRKRYFTIPPALHELIPVTAGAFLVLVVIGYIVGLLRPEMTAPFLEMLTGVMEDRGLVDADGAALMTAILGNNLSALFIAIFLGLIPFIRLPAMELGINALMLGALGAYYQQNGISLVAYLVGTLPHGVTELTALVMAIAAGLNICGAVSGALLHRGEKGAVARAIGDSMLLYARFIVPLLLISAFIETFITPRLLSLFL